MARPPDNAFYGHHQTRRGLSLALTSLFFISALFFLLHSLVSPAYNSRVIETLFLKHARTDPAEVSRSRYGALSEAISGYLSGALDTPQVEIPIDASAIEAFSSRETAHLWDVRDLMRLAGTLKNVAIALLFAAGLLLLRMLVFKERNLPKTVFSSLFRALCGVLVFTAILFVFALIDFGQLFYTLHLILFRNDLWLLDPEQDLLLQLMPEPFFTEYIKNAILGAAIWFLPALLLSGFISFALSRGKHDVS